MLLSEKCTLKLVIGLTLTAGLILPIAAGALEVHKWTDAQGVVHYSESPPPASSADMAAMETFEVDSNYAPGIPPEKDYYSIQNQAKRLEASRLVRERARAAQEAQEAATRYEQPLGQTMVAPQATGYGYGAGYANRYSYGSGYYYNPYYGYPVPYYPRINQGFGGFAQNRFMGPISRGSFVPGVKERAPVYNPAARARAVGGEAFPNGVN